MKLAGNEKILVITFPVCRPVVFSSRPEGLKLVPSPRSDPTLWSTLLRWNHTGLRLPDSDLQETPNCHHNRNRRSRRVRIPGPRLPSPALLRRSARTSWSNNKRNSCAHRFNRSSPFRSNGLPCEQRVLETHAIIDQPVRGSVERVAV